MSPPQPHLVPCPTCGAPVPWEETSRFRPFCSRRCRLIDLGDWLTEQHRIAGDDADGTEAQDGNGDGDGRHRGHDELPPER